MTTKALRATGLVGGAVIAVALFGAGTATANSQALAHYYGGSNMASATITDVHPWERCSLFVDGTIEATGRANDYGNLTLQSGYLSPGTHTTRVSCEEEGFGEANVTVTGNTNSTPSLFGLSGRSNTGIETMNPIQILERVLGTILK